MSMTDRTNEVIELSLEADGDQIRCDIDQDSSIHHEPWVWLDFEPIDNLSEKETHSRRLTLHEAGLLHDRLGLILGRR
jgi:hypothetical protein